MYWMKNACLVAPDEGGYISLGEETDPENILGQDNSETVKVTRERAKKMKHAWKRENRRAACDNKVLIESAVDAEVQRMIEANSSGQNTSEVKLPFPIHDSHSAVYMGGFAVCFRCGSTRSCDMKNNPLRGHCRGWCPKSAKAKLLSTLRGKHPAGSKQGWPDGSKNPCAQRLSASAFINTN